MTPCEEKLVKAKHGLIIGTTGCGKTYFAAVFAYRFFDCYVFVNTSEEVIVTRTTQITCNSVESVIEALEDGYRKIEYIPPEDIEKAKVELKALRLYVFRVGRNLNLEEGSFWITIIIDEIQDYAEKMKTSDANNFFRRGRRNFVRVWGITLAPQDIHRTVLAQTESQILFISGNFQQIYYSNHKIPYDSFLPWLRQQHHFILLNQKQEVTECTPIEPL